MKFAVVEYTTKTGDIWRPTPEKPNYLADPEREIDPTSFGSYTTVFDGEHIPITGFIVGGVASVGTPARLYRKAIKRLRGSWPQTYSLSYLKRFDVVLLVHQISDAHEIAVFAERLKKELPHIFVLGVPTQPFGLLKPYIESNATAKQSLIQYMSACDLFITVVKETRWWYESLTKTPVEYLPQIYPEHYATIFFRPRSNKQKILFVAGVTGRPNIRKGHRVATLLQQEFPDYLIRVTQIPGVDLDLRELQGAKFEIIPFQQWREHLPELARAMLVINTDYTFTRGRVQTDCAAVGTPSLGANSDGQVDLFPELASTPDTPVDELVGMGRGLMSDQSFYDSTVEYARSRLKKYGFEESAARLRMLVRQYREKMYD